MRRSRERSKSRDSRMIYYLQQLGGWDGPQLLCTYTVYIIISFAIRQRTESQAEITRNSSGFATKCENIPTINRSFCDESPSGKSNSGQPPMPANILDHQCVQEYFFEKIPHYVCSPGLKPT